MNTLSRAASKAKSALAFFFSLACIVALGLWPAPSYAGSFSVSPVRIYMKPRDRAVAITLVNEGNTPVALQADINLWSQNADGSDVLALTEDMILSPPIIKLAPQARQVVRLALLRPMDASRQLTYRLIVREVPEATLPQNSGLQVPIALALSMPVFVTPAPAKREMRCELAKLATGAAAARAEINVDCANTGSAYAQVREAVLKRGDTVLARFEGGAYILPGAKKNLSLSAEANASLSGALALMVTYDDNQTESFVVSAP
jgi:fimbrial chaperone protein